MFFFLTHVPWIDLSALEHYDPGQPSILLDDEGKEWGRFQIDRRKPVSLAQMPPALIQAFVASEDRNFFQHKGISVRGILRSLTVNVLKGKRVQGASTITQQLVRLLFFDTRKTFIRKIKEQLLSLSVEQHFSKELILETYLNHIYFGCGIYGVQAASQRFWSKNVQELSAHEAATLAAIVPSPARYCPLIDPQRNQVRRDRVLKIMFQLGSLSKEELDAACTTPVTVNTLDCANSSCAPHVREYIRTLIEQQFGRPALYTGGLIIQTTLNIPTQQAADSAFKKQMQQLRTSLDPSVDGALLTLSVHDGAIKALIGGYDFTSSQFNRALHARRQIGSLLKPLIYSVGLEQKRIELDALVIDEPVTIMQGTQTWTPKNSNKKYEGTMTLAHALAVSKNTIALKTLLDVGIDNVIRYAYRFNLATHLDPYPSLALGCIDTTVTQVARMFNAFSNKGIMAEPHMLVWIKDRWGKKIWKYKSEQTPVLSWKTSSKIIQALSIAFDRFKNRFPGRWKQGDAFGKTGTTNDSRTCWFAGGTPSLTTVVYIGRDDNQSLGKDVYPSTTAFPIWLDFNRNIPQILRFSNEPSLQPVLMHPLTGQLEPYDQSPKDQLNPICILLECPPPFKPTLVMQRHSQLK